MYKNVETNAIAKKHYCFKKGYMQVAIGEKEEHTNGIMESLGISGKTSLCTRLNKGVSNISKEKYDDITALFNNYSITDIWDIIE